MISSDLIETSIHIDQLRTWSTFSLVSAIDENGKFAQKAQWLYFLIKSYGEAVDGQHRADAIEARND